MRGDSQTGGTRGAAAGAGSSQSEHASKPAEPSLASEAPLKREPLRLVHHHPGYLRIRADAFLQAQANSPIVTAARTAAEAVPGFRSWSLSPKTGSVVIQYEPGKLEPDDLLKHIAGRAGFRGVEVATRHKANRRELVSNFLNEVQSVNRAIGELTGERADLRELVPLALVAVSALSFVVNDERGRLPHWFGALYRSYRIFYQWHRREIQTRERVARHAEERAGSDMPQGEPG
jgi:heavy-metal-associated domain-containing protein